MALSGDRAAVAVPGPPRLIVFDKAGLQLTQAPLDVPDSALATSPAGRARHRHDRRLPGLLVGGRHTVALDVGTLTPAWTLRDTLGPPTAYGTGLLAPVRDGLADLDPARGTVLRTLPGAARRPGRPSGSPRRARSCWSSAAPSRRLALPC